MLFGSSACAQGACAQDLVEDQKLDAVEAAVRCLPPVRRCLDRDPVLHQDELGGTDDVRFYDVRADGFSLDDKRNPVEANDLLDVLTAGTATGRTEPAPRSPLVPKADIVAQGYDLSLNRYKEIVHDEIGCLRTWRSSPISRPSKTRSPRLAELKAMFP